MRKIIGLLIVGLLVMSLGVLAMSPRTYTTSDTPVSATVDSNVLHYMYRSYVKMSYNRDNWGHIGLVLQGFTDSHEKAVLRASGDAFSVEENPTVAGETKVVYKPNYLTVKIGGDKRVLYNPTITATRNINDHTIGLVIEHPELGTTNAVFSI